MHLEEGEIVIVRGTKRRDLSGNKIRPYPIFNTGKNNLKYRYEYLTDYFNNTKNLINEKVDTLHSNVNLENLLLYRNIENKAPLAEEKGIEDRKISNDEKLKEILVNEILTMDEVSDINRIIEMTIDEENKRKINFNMKWIEVTEILNKYDKKDLKKYLDIGEDRVKK